MTRLNLLRINKYQFPFLERLIFFFWIFYMVIPLVYNFILILCYENHVVDYQKTNEGPDMVSFPLYFSKQKPPPITNYITIGMLLT